METPIEERPIPGMSAKLLATLLSCTISIILTFSAAWFSMISRSDATNNKVSNLEIRMTTSETNGAARDLEIRSVKETQQNDLKAINEEIVKIRLFNAELSAKLNLK